MKYNIIRSDKQKYIGFLIAKNALSSCRDHLKRCTEVSNFKFLAEYKNTWDSYFKFSFVRNPWDRLVSCWKNKIVEVGYAGMKNRHMSFDTFVIMVTEGQWKSYHDIHWAPQTMCFPHKLVDFVGKFENLQEDFNIICDKIGITCEQLPHVNKTKLESSRHYTEYYNDETRQLVAEKYKKDIMLFGYEFGE